MATAPGLWLVPRRTKQDPGNCRVRLSDARRMLCGTVLVTRVSDSAPFGLPPAGALLLVLVVEAQDFGAALPFGREPLLKTTPRISGTFPALCSSKPSGRGIPGACTGITLRPRAHNRRASFRRGLPSITCNEAGVGYDLSCSIAVPFAAWRRRPTGPFVRSVVVFVPAVQRAA